MALKIVTDHGCSYPEDISTSLVKERVEKSDTRSFVNKIKDGEFPDIDRQELYTWAIAESQKPEHFNFLVQFRPNDIFYATDLIAIMLCTRSFMIKTEADLFAILPEVKRTSEIIHGLVLTKSKQEAEAAE